MQTCATLHVHPACVSNKKMIEQLQSATGYLVIIHKSKPRLIAKSQPLPFDPNDGGHAA
ncbi:hypothetical protein MKZ87_04175 [Pseudomonas sp. MCal1]|uniref:hypothetical protein n=1 Tax=unclassified Pseudomonas TaxID=196821 RepID=UPI001CA750EC|nr:MULTISPECIES: hypothetical protein [unclassified Pseudomonas]MBY8959119.1 hypothetical protein [Pseudomonas sp. MIS38]MCX4216827.1 hypothetical protein [Pseudomonas sp. MCal1]